MIAGWGLGGGEVEMATEYDMSADVYGLEYGATTVDLDFYVGQARAAQPPIAGTGLRHWPGDTAHCSGAFARWNTCLCVVASELKHCAVGLTAVPLAVIVMGRSGLLGLRDRSTVEELAVGAGPR
jgi:hypothetical protein